MQPGQPGWPAPAGPDWVPRELRRLKQENEQLRGQLAAAKAKATAGVTEVKVQGSTLIVTYGDGHTTNFQLA